MKLHPLFIHNQGTTKKIMKNTNSIIIPKQSQRSLKAAGLALLLFVPVCLFGKGKEVPVVMSEKSVQIQHNIQQTNTKGSETSLQLNSILNSLFSSGKESASTSSPLSGVKPVKSIYTTDKKNNSSDKQMQNLPNIGFQSTSSLFERNGSQSAVSSSTSGQEAISYKYELQQPASRQQRVNREQLVYSSTTSSSLAVMVRTNQSAEINSVMPTVSASGMKSLRPGVKPQIFEDGGGDENDLLQGGGDELLTEYNDTPVGEGLMVLLLLALSYV
ncbi:hypothetical protein D0T49_12915, partial [Paludibacter sp. 221]|uniref:hypothetical protein n=1 Tax=Paludibacter sp. 221 TaxID=2302939 RepID=UPI0013D80DE7